MVKQELAGAYERLSTRRKLYLKATHLGNSLTGFGVLIIFFSLICIFRTFWGAPQPIR